MEMGLKEYVKNNILHPFDFYPGKKIVQGMISIYEVLHMLKNRKEYYNVS